jgi:triosephosphate isomerase
MSKILLIANWKCNPPTLKEAKNLFNRIKKGIEIKKKIEVVICPPFVYLAPLAQMVKRRKIVLGAQDAFWEEKGPFTGQISPRMLKDLGCKYVIVGHSERRQLGEDDQLINKKIKRLFKENLTPVLCIGETKEDRKNKKTFDKIKYQIEKGLKGIAKKNLKKLVIAYEPVWAIGTNKPCKPEDVLMVSIFIKKILFKSFSLKKLKTVKILYGGSVNSANAREYLQEGRVEGLLIGGNSLNPEEFIAIIHSLY